jgi:arginine deiminase
MHTDQLHRPWSPETLADVRSETGTLRRVLVHRPGSELDRLDRGNAVALLFDDVLDPGAARAEHDVLTGRMRDAGVEVLYLEDLLTGALREPAVRARAVGRAAAGVPEALRAPLVDRLSRLDPEELAASLIAGNGELEPLPNLMFVRDSSAWLGSQLVLGALANRVRRREGGLLENAYEGGAAIAGGLEEARVLRLPGIEGGDLFCLGERAVLVGVGARTGAAAVEMLAEHLFAAGFERVLAVAVPEERSSIHLDCLMTLIDTDLLLIDRRLRGAGVVEMLPPDGRLQSRIHLGVPEAIAAALGVESMRVVEIADEGEQWNLAANTLALGPCRVVAYAENVRTNEALAAAGVEVLTVPGTQLGRGHGGPRCLTCPLRRDATRTGAPRAALAASSPRP